MLVPELKKFLYFYAFRSEIVFLQLFNSWNSKVPAIFLSLSQSPSYSFCLFTFHLPVSKARCCLSQARSSLMSISLGAFILPKLTFSYRAKYNYFSYPFFFLKVFNSVVYQCLRQPHMCFILLLSLRNSSAPEYFKFYLRRTFL